MKIILIKHVVVVNVKNGSCFIVRVWSFLVGLILKRFIIMILSVISNVVNVIIVVVKIVHYWSMLITSLCVYPSI